MSLYQQWLDKGKPYWEGLSLFHQVPGFSPLKKTLGRGPSPYNTAKLQHVLKVHFSRVAAPAPEQGVRIRQNQEERQELARRRTQLPAEPYSTSAYQGLPFEDLPTPLQRWRIETAERHNEHRALHARLREGIQDPDERLRVCRSIVELTDHITEYWGAEKAFRKHGAVPEAPPTEAERIAALPVAQAERELVNQARPMVYRLQRRLKDKRYKDDDERRGLEMQLQDALRRRQLLVDHLRRYEHR